MAKDVHDDDEGEDPLTQINVDVEPPSIVSVITVTRPGTSAADSEPSTLEPQLSVRGLAGASAPGSHFAPGTIEAPAGADTGEEPEDKTTDSIDARLLEAYESARSVEAAVAQRAVVTPRERRDVPELKPIIITPSEPFRITASGVAAEAPRSSQTKTPRRAPAPIPAAGRPPEVDPELAEPTVKRAPYTGDEDTFDDKADSVENAGTAPTLDVARPRARAIAEDEDTEDETATDAMQKRRSESREELSLSDALPSDEDGGGEPDDEEEDETRTQHDVSRALRQGESGAIGSLPGAARSLVGLEEARLAQRHLPASSAAMPAAAPAAPPIGSVPAPGGGSAESGPNTSGATIRMLFNASLGAVTVNPPPRDQGSAPPHSPMPPPRAAYNPSALPSAFADTVHVSGRPPPPPAPTVRRPPTPHFDPLAKPKRSRGRKFFFFLLFVAAGGAGYHFRHRATPWVMKHLPASLRPAEPAAVPPPPVAPTASAAPDPSAASASPSASASASASASPSASPSSSAHGKKRPRR